MKPKKFTFKITTTAKTSNGVNCQTQCSSGGGGNGKCGGGSGGGGGKCGGGK